jgi:hypothetical protein
MTKNDVEKTVENGKKVSKTAILGLFWAIFEVFIDS